MAYVVITTFGWSLFIVIALGEPVGLLLTLAAVGLGYWWLVLRKRLRAETSPPERPDDETMRR